MMQTFVLRLSALDEQRHDHELALYKISDAADGKLTLVAKEFASPLPDVADAPPPYTAAQMRKRFTAALEPDRALKDIGDQLFTMLALGKVGAHLNAVKEFRLILDIASDLRDLPWELMSSGMNRFFMNSGAPMCRGRYDSLQPLDLHTWPLRLLVVVGSNSASGKIEQGQFAVNAEDELARIRDAIAQHGADIDLEECIRRPRAEVFERIRTFQPHILHYIGHGGIYNGRPMLELRSDTFDYWDRDSIYTVTRDINQNIAAPDRLRLVVLNACRSGSSPADQRDPWSISEAFLEAGVPAVVGMSSDVADDSAARFADGFYHALAEGNALDEAMVKARIAVIRDAAGDEFERREWAAPCLIMRCDPASVIHVGSGINIEIPSERRSIVSTLPGLDVIHRLVDRRSERYQTWKGFKPNKRRVMALVGETEVGKTKFAHMLMERCALCDHELRYVDMKNRGTDFLSLLFAIRCGSDQPRRSALTESLPLEAFRLFYQKLSEVLGVAVAECFADGDQQPVLRDEHYRAAKLNPLFTAFRTGLQEIARPARPLVLVIDHLQLGEDAFKYIHTYLLAPFTGPRAPNEGDINFVLLLSTDQMSMLQKLDQQRDIYERFDLMKFPGVLWSELVDEFFRRTFAGQQLSAEAIQQIEYFKAASIAAPWKPVQFFRLAGLVEGFDE